MNRWARYQAGEATEDLLLQAGSVAIHDGDNKHPTYEHGTASLTMHRVIWADSSHPDRRIYLHHSLVTSVERGQKGLFSRSGKITINLKPINECGNLRPLEQSTANHLRLVFKGKEDEEFLRRYTEALDRKTWERHSSGSSSAGSRTVGPSPAGGGGIGGIERRIAEAHVRTTDNISNVFDDMSRLMEQAREMVTLARSISEKLRNKQGEFSTDETIRFKSHLLSLGVADPVTKSTFGASATYFEQLAHEISRVMEPAIRDNGGMLTLPEIFCRINRARFMELISPDDLLHACEAMDTIQSPLQLHKFDSGVLVLQLRSSSVEATIPDTVDYVKEKTSASPHDLAAHVGTSVVLAKERLLAAEQKGLLCRDDTVEGLAFYTNRFMDDSASPERESSSAQGSALSS